MRSRQLLPTFDICEIVFCQRLVGHRTGTGMMDVFFNQTALKDKSCFRQDRLSRRSSRHWARLLWCWRATVPTLPTSLHLSLPACSMGCSTPRELATRACSLTLKRTGCNGCMLQKRWAHGTCSALQPSRHSRRRFSSRRWARALEMWGRPTMRQATDASTHTHSHVVRERWQHAACNSHWWEARAWVLLRLLQRGLG